MDFVVPIFLKALFEAAKKAGVLELAQKTGEALYEKFVQDTAGSLRRFLALCLPFFLLFIIMQLRSFKFATSFRRRIAYANFFSTDTEY